MRLKKEYEMLINTLTCFVEGRVSDNYHHFRYWSNGMPYKKCYWYDSNTYFL